MLPSISIRSALFAAGMVSAMGIPGTAKAFVEFNNHTSRPIRISTDCGWRGHMRTVIAPPHSFNTSACSPGRDGFFLSFRTRRPNGKPEVLPFIGLDFQIFDLTIDTHGHLDVAPQFMDGKTVLWATGRA